MIIKEYLFILYMNSKVEDLKIMNLYFEYIYRLFNMNDFLSLKNILYIFMNRAIELIYNFNLSIKNIEIYKISIHILL